jgi:6-phosphogluconolactonase
LRRGHHSIAIYSIDQQTGLLSPVSIDSTLGKTPRHFGISPDGKHLLAADQDSDYMKVFSLHADKGTMEYTGEHYDLGTPCFVLFQQPFSS